MLLAQTPNANHKRWYSWYCDLMLEGLVAWQLGTAFLTEDGREWLRNNKETPAC